jgi:alpha-D-ribose 1-methylphosphonate 5-triphosphate diphosphatase
MGLTDRGSLAVGLSADLVVVEQASVPRVRLTLRAGRPIYADGTPVLDEVLTDAAL